MRAPNHESRSTTHAALNPESETRNPKPKTRNPKQVRALEAHAVNAVDAKRAAHKIASIDAGQQVPYRGTSLMKKNPLLGPYGDTGEGGCFL